MSCSFMSRVRPFVAHGGCIELAGCCIIALINFYDFCLNSADRDEKEDRKRLSAEQDK